jgi:hypothetical protein
MSILATVLRIKFTEVLYVSWARHWFSLLRYQADASRSAHLGYPVGTFPAGEKFVHALPTKHPSEDQIIHLELPALHEPMVVAPERLPAACIFNSSLPSSLIDQVDILTSELVLRGFVTCLYTQRVHGHFWGKAGVTSPQLNRINSILIPLSCNFFFGSPSAKNSRVKRGWPGAISGWVTDREVFPGA